MAKRTGSKILAVLGSVFVLVGVAGLTSLITKDIVERNAGLKDFTQVKENLILKSGNYTEGFSSKVTERLDVDEELDAETKYIDKISTKVTKGQDYQITQVIRDSFVGQYYIYQDRTIFEFTNLNELDFTFKQTISEITSFIDVGLNVKILDEESSEERQVVDGAKGTASCSEMFTTNVYFTSNPEAKKLDFTAGESKVERYTNGRIFYSGQIENFDSIYRKNNIESFSTFLEEDLNLIQKQNISSHYFQIVIEREFDVNLYRMINVEDLTMENDVDTFFLQGIGEFDRAEIDWSSIRLNSIKHPTNIKDEITFTKK